jgi:hypothetical protein
MPARSDCSWPERQDGQVIHLIHLLCLGQLPRRAGHEPGQLSR